MPRTEGFFSPVAPSALNMRAVTKTFGRGLARSVGRVFALHDLDLSVSYGEIVCVTGEEGAGKTALLQCAAGLLKCDSGSITWFGVPLAAGVPQSDVAFISATPIYYPFLTVRDVVQIAASREPRVARLAWSSRETLAALELDTLVNTAVTQLSRQQLRALSIAEALVKCPLALLVDTSPSESESMSSPCFRALRNFAERGGAVMISARNTVTAAQTATRIIFLHEGTVRRAFYWEAVGSLSRLATPPLALAERLH